MWQRTCGEGELRPVGLCREKRGGWGCTSGSVLLGEGSVRLEMGWRVAEYGWKRLDAVMTGRLQVIRGWTTVSHHDPGGANGWRGGEEGRK